MKAYSGVIVTRWHAPNFGIARLEFDQWPDDGQNVTEDGTREGDKVGEMAQSRQVGGEGNFDQLPVYVAHLREYEVEDKAGVGGSEIDRWMINSDANRGRLSIRWDTPEKNSKIEEIGFLVIGE